MYKKWLILAGCFFGGILLCGLGTGIEFMEVSNFTYAGDREQGKIVEENLTYHVEEDVDVFHIYTPYYSEMGKASVVSDNSLPEDRIEIDIKYNDDFEKPYLHSYIYESEPEIYEAEDAVAAEDMYDEVDIDENEEYAYEEKSDSRTELDAETKMEAQITVVCPSDSVKLFMKYKDVILADIKNGQIGTYYDYDLRYFEITVRCHPSMTEKIELVNW